MKLGTKVFDMYPSYYRNLSELAEAMSISVSEVYRVRSGKRNINQKFIVGALSAFPQFSFDELFYLSPELVIGDAPSPAGATSDGRQEAEALALVAQSGDSMSFAEIGRQVGLSRERVRQIARKEGFAARSRGEQAELVCSECGCLSPCECGCCEPKGK